MERSIGRDAQPTTEAGEPDARQQGESEPAPDVHTPEVDEEIRRRLRDLPPTRYRDDTGITDLDELQRHIDPLDPRRPRRVTDDPLDPERRSD